MKLSVTSESGAWARVSAESWDSGRGTGRGDFLGKEEEAVIFVTTTKLY